MLSNMVMTDEIQLLIKYNRTENYSVCESVFCEEGYWIQGTGREDIINDLYCHQVINKWNHVFLTMFKCFVEQEMILVNDVFWRVDISLCSEEKIDCYVRTVFMEKMIKSLFDHKMIREKVEWNQLKNNRENYIIVYEEDEIDYEVHRVLCLNIGYLKNTNCRCKGLQVGQNIAQKIKSIHRRYDDGSFLIFDLERKWIRGKVSLGVRQKLKEKYDFYHKNL